MPHRQAFYLAVSSGMPIFTLNLFEILNTSLKTPPSQFLKNFHPFKAGLLSQHFTSAVERRLTFLTFEI